MHCFLCCCWQLPLHRSVLCPKESEKLQCAHENGNSSDMFAIKTCVYGKTVGHLPRDISIFIIDSYNRSWSRSNGGNDTLLFKVWRFLRSQSKNVRNGH